MKIDNLLDKNSLKKTIKTKSLDIKNEFGDKLFDLGEDVFLGAIGAILEEDEAIAVTDTNGAIVCVNKGFEILSGYTQSEILGKTLAILKSGRQNNVFYENLWKKILSGQNFHGIIVNRNKLGHIYYQSTTIKPIRNAQNKIIYFISIASDITEQYLDDKRMDSIGRIASPLIKQIEFPLHQIQASACNLRNYVSKQKSLEPYKDLNSIYYTSKQIQRALRVLTEFITPIDSVVENIDVKKAIQNIVDNLKLETKKHLNVKIIIYKKIKDFKSNNDDMFFVVTQSIKKILSVIKDSVLIEVKQFNNELEITISGNSSSSMNRFELDIELLLVEKIISDYCGSVSYDFNESKQFIKIIWPSK